ncbi:MAG: DUF3168 domain-containing protein [Pseudomonadota bacterium]
MMALLSDALQTAIYSRLAGDAPLATLVGAHVYDAVPAGPLPDIYVLIGEEAVKDASDKLAQGALHDVKISVISSVDSFLALKEAAAAITSAMDAPVLTLSRGAVAGLWFRGAQSKRNAAGQRRIDLSFRVRVDG